MPSAIPFTFNRTSSPYRWLSTPPQPVDQPPADQYLPTPDVPNLTPNDLYEGNRAIRPKLDPTISDPLEAQRALRQNLELYEPQKSHGIKRLAPVVPTVAAGAQAGGGWGALGGLGVGLLMSKLDPTFADRIKKQRELGKTNQTIGVLQGERDADVQDKLRQAQLGNIQAETEALQHPTPKPRPSAFRVLAQDEGGLKKGTKIATEFNPQTGKWEDTGRILDLPNEKAESDKIGSATRIVNEGEYGLPAGTKIHLMPNGEDALVNDKPLVAEPAPTDKVGPNVAFINQNISQSIADAQGEKAKIKDALANTAEYLPDTQDTNGAVVKHPNPIYKDLQDRDRALDTQIREWRMKLKPEPKSSGPIKPAKDGKFHYTEAQIRASLQPGQSYEEIYAKLKARSNVVIDEE